jgi:hypothetical protein
MNPRYSAEFGISRNVSIRQMKGYVGIEDRQRLGDVCLQNLRREGHEKQSGK